MSPQLNWIEQMISNHKIAGSSPAGDSKNMNYKTIQELIEKTEPVWNCISRRNQHEVGCPHKEWTKEDLLKALISKKKFEASGLSGTVLT